MELRVYAFLLFGTMVVFYLLGYQAPIIHLLANLGGENNPESNQNAWNFIINQLLSIFTNPAFLLAVGASGVTAFLSGGNYSVTFLFPIIMLIIIANIFVLPTSFIFQAQLPLELKTIILAWFNLLLTLGAVEFVRGGTL